MQILMFGNKAYDGINSYVYDLVTMYAKNHNIWFWGDNAFLNFTGNVQKETELQVDKYDLAYFNYFRPYPNINCRKIFHTHNAILDYGYTKNIESVLENEVDFLIVVNSDFQTQQFIEMGVLKSQIVKIPNYVNEEIYVPIPEIEKIPNSIILPARIEENNRPIFEPIVKAMRQLPEYRLTLMGHVSEKLQDKLDNFLSKARNQNIKYIEPKSNFEKIQEFNRHEIGIGVGRSARELVLCGLPTLVYREGFAGWIGDSNIEKLERDNVTTRWYEEEPEGSKIDKIVQAIRNPETFDRATAVARFGMNANKAIYATLLD